jgi:hypothetical protein
MKKLLPLILTAGIALTGCQTANYNLDKLTGLSPARVEEIRRIADKPVEKNPIFSQESGVALGCQKTIEVLEPYANLSPQKIRIFYREKSSSETTEQRTIDTTGPLNLNGNAYSIMNLEQRTALVPDNSKISGFDLGKPDSETLSSRTPGNQISNHDGINLIETYSNSGHKNFAIEIKQTSRITPGLRNQDDYEVAVFFNQPCFSYAKKQRKDCAFFTDIATDAGIASIAGPVPAAIVAIEDGLDSIVARIESTKAPANAFTIDNADYITKMQRSASLASSILDNSASTKTQEIILVNLHNPSNNQPSGLGVIYANGAYDVQIGHNCANFKISKDRGNHLIYTLRRFSKVVPVFIRRTKTNIEYRDRTSNSGGGRTGTPGGDYTGAGDRTGSTGGN